jgi:hypothetical protein
MKNKFISALSVIIFSFISFGSVPLCRADVIYYNFDSGITVVFNALPDGSLVRQVCPGNKVLSNGRADCAGGAITPLMKIADLNSVIADNLKHTVKAGGALDPLSADVITALMAGMPYAQIGLDSSKKALLSEQANDEQILAKFGADAGVQAKLKAANAGLAQIDQKANANSNYLSALNELAQLTKAYLELVTKPQTVEVDASKVRGSLANAISQILLHYAGDQSATPLRLGQVVTINQGASCFQCSEQESKRLRGRSAAINGVGFYDTHYWYSLDLSGSDWWIDQDLTVGEDIWQN